MVHFFCSIKEVKMSIFSLSIRELRPKLPEVVADVLENMSRYVITKRGKPAAVIINISDYNSLLESLELQENEVLAKEIAESKADSKKGRLIDDIKMEL